MTRAEPQLEVFGPEMISVGEIPTFFDSTRGTVCGNECMFLLATVSKSCRVRYWCILAPGLQWVVSTCSDVFRSERNPSTNAC